MEESLAVMTRVLKRGNASAASTLVRYGLGCLTGACADAILANVPPPLQMSFTDEEFERLEKEVATLFLPPVLRETGAADGERIDRIMDRVDAKEPKAAEEKPGDESSPDSR